MDVVVLHNRRAGNADCSAGQLTRVLRDAGYRPRYHDLRAALKKPSVLREGEFVVVAGGDGSMRKVALALLEDPRPMAPLPLGTANNIARSLGVEGTPAEIVRRWSPNRRRKLDVGVARGPWGRKYFFEGIGIGLISRSMDVLAVIDEVGGLDFKSAEDKLHRDVCVFAAMAHEIDSRRVVVKRNGGPKKKDDFLLLEVLNIRRAGPGLEIAPRADPFDGWFDVVGVTENQRKALVAAVLRIVSGRDAGKLLHARRARTLRIKVRPGEVRIDDNTVTLDEPATIDISLQHGALELILPKPA
jgi:diacylglycerol kinase (ATP)